MDRVQNKLEKIVQAFEAISDLEKRLKKHREELFKLKTEAVLELFSTDDSGKPVHGYINFDKPIVYENHIFYIDQERADTAERRSMGLCMDVAKATIL